LYEEGELLEEAVDNRIKTACSTEPDKSSGKSESNIVAIIPEHWLRYYHPRSRNKMGKWNDRASK